MAAAIVTLSNINDWSFAQTTDTDADAINGYITGYHPGSGQVFINRSGRKVTVALGTPVQIGDVIVVSGDASAEVRTNKGREVVRTYNSGYTIKSEQPGPPGWFAVFGRQADAIRSLLNKMPAGFAHNESKGEGDCEQDSFSTPLHAVAGLNSNEQWLPTSAKSISIAWEGGVAPYILTLSTSGPRGVDTHDRSTHCVRAIDKLDLGDTPAQGQVTVTISDAQRARIQWTVHFLEDSKFENLVQASDPLALAVRELTNVQPQLHLAGLTELTRLASNHFVAWRLAEAVKEGDFNRIAE